MIGQETKTLPPPFIEAERGPTSKELRLWDRAMKLGKRASLKAYAMRMMFLNILEVHKFAQAHKIPLDEPDLPDLEKRMLTALAEIERAKDLMCAVNQLDLGVRLNANGTDLDIIDPNQNMGWIIPAAIGAVIVVGIIARWIYLEKEVDEVTRDYNGILRRSDMALCEDPGSKICADWKKTKAVGGYSQRETVLDSIKNAVKAAGSGAKTGLGWGLALLLPILGFLYLPRQKG